MSGFWKPAFEIEAKGSASPETQVKYLIAVLKIKEDEIASLRLELETLRLERELQDKQFNRQVDALVKARLFVLERHKTHRPWRWYAPWRKRYSGVRT